MIDVWTDLSRVLINRPADRLSRRIRYPSKIVASSQVRICCGTATMGS